MKGPIRDENLMDWRSENWWVFGDPSRNYRAATRDLQTCIVTSRTAKFRCFQLWSTNDLCESEVVIVGLDRPCSLSILSSKIDEIWSLSICSCIGIGNDPRYNNSKIFDPFPFSDLTETQRTHLRQLGEDLDAHLKRQQAAHPKLSLTQMYNVLEKLRAGEIIEGKDKELYDQGLISILRDLHDRIDAAVADAYGWPVILSDEEIFLRHLGLIEERAEEEARGLIRWLRPDYQNPTGVQAAKGKTADMDLGVIAKIEKAPWPKTLPDQIAAVREALQDMGEATPDQIARRFLHARAKTVEPLMQSLAALGQAELGEDGRYAA